MSETTRLVTAEELERYPDDGYRYELVEGRIIRMSPVTFEHGRIVVRLATLLSRHLEQHPVGVIGADVGFKLASNPDTVRGPDIAFLRHNRVPPRGTRGFVNGPPDLVFEVVSPEDRPSEVRAKTEQYLARGVAVVVVVDPDDKSVTIARLGNPAHVLRSPNDAVDLADVITGFNCRLQEIFD